MKQKSKGTEQFTEDTSTASLSSTEEQQPQGGVLPRTPPHDQPIEQKLAEMKDMLQRTHADFVNYKKRAEADWEKARQFASVDIVEKLLPILDSFALAVASAKKQETSKEELTKGMEQLYAQFSTLLEKEGLKKMVCVKKPFDPYRQEALMTEERSDVQDGTVLEEFQCGYQFKDKVIRHAKVKIAKAKTQEPKQPETMEVRK
ncbi:nucleotide exchange factor GrpE [Candidatus Woesearchaeota archaeon]|nr:nucleotide exchange factor GrpE [Candidatus Woesearchaeota archaeon]